MCVSVCVGECVFERKREREREKEKKKERERKKDRDERINSVGEIQSECWCPDFQSEPKKKLQSGKQDLPPLM